jgi:hypothetical protein
VGKIQSRKQQKGLREFDNPQSYPGQEARDVCGCESEDFEGNESALGKVSSSGQKIDKLTEF